MKVASRRRVERLVTVEARVPTGGTVASGDTVVVIE